MEIRCTLQAQALIVGQVQLFEPGHQRRARRKEHEDIWKEHFLVSVQALMPSDISQQKPVGFAANEFS